MKRNINCTLFLVVKEDVSEIVSFLHWDELGMNALVVFGAVASEAPDFIYLMDQVFPQSDERYTCNLSFVVSVFWA